jgi:hypothetical protein
VGKNGFAKKGKRAAVKFSMHGVEWWEIGIKMRKSSVHEYEYDEDSD